MQVFGDGGVLPDPEVFDQDVQDAGRDEGREASAFPVKSEYGLSESGVEIIGVVREIKRWVLKWKIENLALRGAGLPGLRVVIARHLQVPSTPT